MVENILPSVGWVKTKLGCVQFLKFPLFHELFDAKVLTSFSRHVGEKLTQRCKENLPQNLLLRVEVTVQNSNVTVRFIGALITL